MTLSAALNTTLFPAIKMALVTWLISFQALTLLLVLLEPVFFPSTESSSSRLCAFAARCSHPIKFQPRNCKRKWDIQAPEGNFHKELASSLLTFLLKGFGIHAREPVLRMHTWVSLKGWQRKWTNPCFWMTPRGQRSADCYSSTQLWAVTS